ncbi:MAG TPA: glycogen synthase GlgA [Usitatibacter sp.]|jgi:starch synthase|nr:glycogen synthase GlgA [Usitatibacter sp.]
MTVKILFATPECAPLVKTGGLGDVSAALPAALAKAGLDVRVLLPGYREVLDADRAAKPLATVKLCGVTARLLASRLPSGVELIVLDAPDLYVRNGGPYQTANGEDWNDNALRFGVLSRAAALLGTRDSPIAWRADVVHCNDWPTALAPVYLHAASAPRAGSLVTIHNLAFQGVFPFDQAHALEIPAGSQGTDGVEFYGKVSFLKGGLVFADAINAVSPTYAREIQGEELGFGLDGVLRHRASVLSGVLNGIDVEAWNPANDKLIPARYDAKTLAKKRENKKALKARMGLAGPDELPLAGIVTRLTHQKGIDILIDALPRLAALNMQVAVVGTGDRALVQRLEACRARMPGTLAFMVAFEEPLAHLVEAGSDVFLMPSRFEPCGMNQMYSQRYGTPPIVNPTGGLADTVIDDSEGTHATGFHMRAPDANGLVEAASRAVTAMRDATHWRRLQASGMARDFGWERAARAYTAIYERIRPTS